MDATYADRIRQLRGVEDASGFLLETVSLEEEGVYGLPALGIRKDSRMLADFTVKQGRSFQPSDGKVVLLGSQLAARLERGVGARLLFFEDEEYEVVGVFESRSAWENGALILPLKELQRLTDRDQQVTFVNVVLQGTPNSAQLQQTRQRIEALDDKLSALPTQDFVATDTRIRIASAMAWMTCSIALMIGAIGMLNTMMTSVFERTREIGILRAVGWRKSRVVRMILLEASLLSTMAALVGIITGTVVVRVMSLLPAVNSTIEPYVDWSVVLQGFLIAIVIGLTGACYPAYRGARMLPTIALRHE